MSDEPNKLLITVWEPRIENFESKCNALLNKKYYLACAGRTSGFVVANSVNHGDFWAIFVKDKNMLDSNR